MVDLAVRRFGSKTGPERVVAPTKESCGPKSQSREGTSRMGLIVGEGT